MKLQELASVRSGLVLARKQSREPTDYRYPLINLRCIQPEGIINLNESDIYEAKEPLKEEYLSRRGDIVVRLTAPYTAVLIDDLTSGMVISSKRHSSESFPSFEKAIVSTTALEFGLCGS